MLDGAHIFSISCHLPHTDIKGGNIFLISKSVALTKVKEFEKIARTKNNRDRKRNSVVCPHEGKIDS